MAWCDDHGLELHQIAPAAVGEYLRDLRTNSGSPRVEANSEAPPRSHPAFLLTGSLSAMLSS